MQDDDIFRLILALALATTLPIGIYYRIRSQRSREQLNRRKEGLFILFTLRPIGLVCWLGLLTFIVSPDRMIWSSFPLPLWLRWAGVGIGIPAAALLIWTFISLETNITDTVVTRRHHKLIVTGPYQFVRHPFYLAAGMALTSCSLVMANWFISLMGGIGFALLIKRTAIEEKHLAERFGDNYLRYMELTGRFIPRIHARKVNTTR